MGDLGAIGGCSISTLIFGRPVWNRTGRCSGRAAAAGTAAATSGAIGDICSLPVPRQVLPQATPPLGDRADRPSKGHPFFLKKGLHGHGHLTRAVRAGRIGALVDLDTDMYVSSFSFFMSFEELGTHCRRPFFTDAPSPTSRCVARSVTHSPGPTCRIAV